MKSFLKKHIYPMLSSCLNFLFPVFCVGCKTRNEILCNVCASKISRAAIYRKHSWIYPLFDYHDPIIKKSIWKLKYRERTILAKPLANLLYEHMLDELHNMNIFGSMEKPLLIPIPLSKKGLRVRGYNQSLLIAKHVSFIERVEKPHSGSIFPNFARILVKNFLKYLDIPPNFLLRLEQNLGKYPRKQVSRHAPESSFELAKNVLYKIKDTKKQMEIKDKKERLKNLRGSFAVKNPERVVGRNIILIDDVVTTGATLSEAKKVLKKAGAKKIIAFTIAH